VSIHFVVESGRTAPGVAVRVPGGFRLLDPDPGFRHSSDQELFCGGRSRAARGCQHTQSVGLAPKPNC
jgi:hypothetical protein